MIEAAQPAVLDPAVAEIGAAMRAVETEQAEAVAIVAKQHQLLAEDLDRHGRAAGRQLVGERDRMPVAAHQRTARRVRTGACYQLVLCLRQHHRLLSVIASITDTAAQPPMTTASISKPTSLSNPRMNPKRKYRRADGPRGHTASGSGRVQYGGRQPPVLYGTRP